MSFLDRLFGRSRSDDASPPPGRTPGGRRGRSGGGPVRSPDEVALERYRYLLRTAPPDQLEQAHAEAFARLTLEQRQMALQQIAELVPEDELRYASADPGSLARLATRAELRQPGTIERAWGARGAGAGTRGGGAMGQSGSSGAGYGGGFGGPGLGGFFLSSLAGAFIGSTIAQSMFNDYGYPPGDPGGDPGDSAANYDDTGGGVGGEDSGASGSDDAGESSGGYWGDGADGADSTDVGGGSGTADAGDLGGGDLGGGDFGGGDFGGGDFGGGDFGGGGDL